MFCDEEEAVKRIPNPNGEWDDSGDWWDVCWECEQYIEWSKRLAVWNMVKKHTGLPEPKPFDEWLFEKHQVYPKHEWMACVIKKNPGVIV